MSEFANRLANQVDTNEVFFFVGVSLGGMLAQTLAESLPPAKTIILSSAKGKQEIPFRYRFMKVIPIHRIIPAIFFKWGSYLAQPLVEPDRRKNKEAFKAMLKAKESKFLKRATHMIVSWKKTGVSPQTIHIHGIKDQTLPIRKVDADYYVINGSHMMTLTMGKALSPLVNKLLLEKPKKP